MRVRGHTLVYGHVVDPPNPKYLSETTDAAALRALMADHVRTVTGRYRGRVNAWDVVNEPLQPFGTSQEHDGLSDNVFSKVLGPGYIGEAIRLAREADPGAQLFINDFGVLDPGPKQDRYFRLVKELRESGAPLDAVGFQAHMVPLLAPATPREQIPEFEANYRKANAGAGEEKIQVGLAELRKFQGGIQSYTGLDDYENSRLKGFYAGLAGCCAPAGMRAIWTTCDNTIAR